MISWMAFFKYKREYMREKNNNVTYKQMTSLYFKKIHTNIINLGISKWLYCGIIEHGGNIYENTNYRFRTNIA